MAGLATILNRPEGRSYIFGERAKLSKINVANKLHKFTKDFEGSSSHRKYQAFTLHTQVC